MDKLEVLTSLFHSCSDLHQRLAETLNDDFALKEQLPYGKWCTDVGGLTFLLDCFEGRFQPGLNHSAAVPAHSCPVNPLTGCAERTLIPDLLYCQYSNEVKEKQKELERYFESSYTADKQQLLHNIERFNVGIQNLLDAAQTEYGRRLKEYKSEQSFGVVLSSRLKVKPKDFGVLEGVLRSIADGEGFKPTPHGNYGDRVLRP
eukprot:GHVS01031932.1.p1 GENE.GHVS01031932.1~~GHVS01031932.1.p1  ORF type:complete len:203 (+),score=20.55 GHVS01031932.1:103-711(+)